MNTLRTLVIFAVLGAVGYGVYATLNRHPPVGPPEPLPVGWDADPAVQLVEEASGPPQIMTGAPAGPPLGAGSPAPFPQADPSAAGTGDAPPFGSAPASAAAAAPPFNATPPPPTESAAAAPAYAASPDQLASQSPIEMTAPPNNAAPADPNSMAGAPATALNNAPPYDAAAAQVPAAPAAEAYSAPAAPAVEMPQQTPPPSTTPPGDPAAAAQIQQPITAPATGEAAAAAAHAPAGDFATTWQNVQQMLAQDRLVDAHRELSRWYADPRLGANDQQVQQLLDQLAGTIIYSRESLLEPAYEVQPADTLEKIGEHYQIPWQLLGKINGIQNAQALQVGEKLKVVRGPFSADVDVARFRLTIWLNDLYAGSFPVGLGVDQTTPDGIFGVDNKLENPTYYGPDQVIDANDPANPLGERWISIGNHLGIHGTNDPQTIGRAASRGCIRLTEADVNDVYDILSVGSRVTIRR